MTHEDKVKYLRIALSLQNIGVNEEITDRVITTYEKVLELGGGFSVDHAVEIEFRMDKKYAKKKLENE